MENIFNKTLWCGGEKRDRRCPDVWVEQLFRSWCHSLKRWPRRKNTRRGRWVALYVLHLKYLWEIEIGQERKWTYVSVFRKKNLCLSYRLNGLQLIGDLWTHFFIHGECVKWEKSSEKQHMWRRETLQGRLGERNREVGLHGSRERRVCFREKDYNTDIWSKARTRKFPWDSATINSHIVLRAEAGWQ